MGVIIRRGNLNQPRMGGMERTGYNNYHRLNKLKQFLEKKEGFLKPFVVTLGNCIKNN